MHLIKKQLIITTNIFFRILFEAQEAKVFVNIKKIIFNILKS